MDDEGGPVRAFDCCRQCETFFQRDSLPDHAGAYGDLEVLNCPSGTSQAHVENDWETFRIQVGSSELNRKDEWAGFLLPWEYNFGRMFDVGPGSTRWDKHKGKYMFSGNKYEAGTYWGPDSGKAISGRLPRPSDGHGAYAHDGQWGEWYNLTFASDGSATTGWTNYTDLPELKIPRYETIEITDQKILNQFADDQVDPKFSDDLKLLSTWFYEDGSVAQIKFSTLYSYSSVIAGQKTTILATEKNDLQKITVPTNVTFKFVLSDFLGKQYMTNHFNNGTYATVHSMKDPEEYSGVSTIIRQCRREEQGGCPEPEAVNLMPPTYWHLPTTGRQGGAEERRRCHN